jgi:DNA-binding HxlR family transcriptional regulator
VKRAGHRAAARGGSDRHRSAPPPVTNRSWLPEFGAGSDRVSDLAVHSSDDLGAEFAAFHEQSRAFSRRIRAALGGTSPRDGRIRAAENVHVARTMFGKWSLEILSTLYGERTVGFEELRRSLHGITASVLSYQLKRMESIGLVSREVQTTRPVRVRYRLTDKGLTVAVLGEPVFLFLQYSEFKNRPSARPAKA